MTNTYRNNQNRNNDNGYTYKKIYIPLSEYYKDKDRDIFLPNGESYNLANSFTSISSNQLRKILALVKQAKAAKSFEESKRIMFSIVPLTAYNSGRDKKLSNLYDFIRNHINEKTITSKNDIEMFDKLYTNVIAYQKVLGGK